MIFSGGDFDDAIDVIDVWLYADAQDGSSGHGVHEPVQEIFFSI